MPASLVSSGTQNGDRERIVTDPDALAPLGSGIVVEPLDVLDDPLGQLVGQVTKPIERLVSDLPDLLHHPRTETFVKTGVVAPVFCASS